MAGAHAPEIVLFAKLVSVCVSAHKAINNYLKVVQLSSLFREHLSPIDITDVHDLNNKACCGICQRDKSLVIHFIVESILTHLR